ncbi:MAG: hypothetical protein ABIO83_03125 [Ilumatobacteraceae bacterium]
MGELVLLVVAAAWAAVLIPPLLRSRIENRPNSSVTDFRRQLNKLQSTVPNRASGSMRGMARPLAQSPLHRPAAAGRPGMQHAQMRRGGTRTHGGQARASTAAPVRDPGAHRRSHGDATGGHARPQHFRSSAQSRQTHVAHHNVSAVDQVRRRRSNVLFMLVLATAATLFLAATTQEPAMLYMFAAAFLGLCGYAYLLSQARQRETSSWPQDWMHHR